MNHRVEESVARYLAALEPPLLRSFDLLAGAPKGVARLRELILSLAVRGKLVPQDPSDEPASVLLERIRAEKARLVAEGKIRREKPLAEFSEGEKPFGLPAGWAWSRVGDVAFSQAGFAFKATLFNDVAAGLPLIRIRDVGANDPSTFYSGEFRPEFLVEVNDWLISMDGDFRVARWTGPKALLNQRVSRLVFFVPELAQSLICNGLQFELTKLQGNKAYTTVDHLSGSQISTRVIALPPLAEQFRIVARVDALMRLCDELETKGCLEAEQHARLVGTLFETLAASESAQALAENWQRIAEHFDLLLDRPEAVDALEHTLLQLAVRGLLVPQDPAAEPASTLLVKIRAEKHRLIAAGKLKRDKPLTPITEDEKPFELPEGWEWARFGEVALIASNLVSPSLYGDLPQVAPDSIEKGTGRLIEMRSVKEAGITSPNHRFRVGQILYSKIRPSLSKAVVVDFEGLCSADMYPVNSLIDTDYLHRYILSQPFLEQVKVAENRVKMPKLNQEALNSFLVPVPPLAEQSRIVARVEQLRCLCADLRARLGEARATQSRLAEALVEQTV